MGKQNALTNDQVLDALATGATLSEVANRLYVDPSTIRNYIQRMRTDGITIPNTAKQRKDVFGYRLAKNT